MKILYLAYVELYGKVSSLNSSHARSQQIVMSFDSQNPVSQPLCPQLAASSGTASASGRSALRDSSVEVVMGDLPRSWACPF